MDEFGWQDLKEHLTSWRQRDFRDDIERDAQRIATLEFVVEALLEKLERERPDKLESRAASERRNMGLRA